MNKDLEKLESEILQNPFDASLRESYAKALTDNNDIEKSLQQWEILSQQFSDNADYIKKISKLKDILSESYQVSDDTSNVKHLKLVEGKEPALAEHNIVNLSRPNKVRFVDIAGMDEIKKVIRRRIIDPFKNPGLFQKFKRNAGGGVLLFGPPGCGKTMIAKAIASECEATFLSIGISDILNMYIGESESNLANVFEQARNSTPSVIFFDELDALAYSRSKANSDHTRTLVNEFLAQLDGLAGENEKVLILGATNMPWDIDDAMKRPGRFARQIFLPPPDLTALSEMLEIKLREVPCENIDFKKIASKCNKFSGADIDGLIELAKDNTIDDIMESGNERKLNEDDLLTSIDEITPSTLEWLQTARNLIKYANASGAYKDVAKYIKTSGSL